MMRTVVALYDRFEDAQQAVHALNDSGFSREDINMVARDVSGEYSRYLDQKPDQTATTADGAATGAGIGAVIGGLGGLLVGLGALAIPGIGPVLAAGPIITTLAGAGVGAVAGGIVGALVDLGIPEEHAQYYAEGIRRGGTLVVLRTSDDRAETARMLMNRFNPVDIETRADAWRHGQWTGFDQSREPLGSDQMEFNRSAPMPVTGRDTGEMHHDQTMGSDINSANQDMNTVSGTDQTGSGLNRDRNSSGWQHDDSDMDVDPNRPVDRQHDWQSGSDFNQPSSSFDRGNDWNNTGSTFSQQNMNPEGMNRNIPVTGSTDQDDQGDDRVDRMDQHMKEDIYSNERVNDTNMQDIPVTGGVPMEMEEVDEVYMFPVDTEDWNRYDSDFRSDYQSRYGATGNQYIYYQPAYQYGYYLASDPQYSGYDWNRMEPMARQEWQRRGLKGAWDDVKDAVHHAWDAVSRHL